MYGFFYQDNCGTSLNDALKTLDRYTSVYAMLDKHGKKFDANRANDPIPILIDYVRGDMIQGIISKIGFAIYPPHIFESDQLVYLRGPKPTTSTEYDKYFHYDNAVEYRINQRGRPELKKDIYEFFPREEAEEFIFDFIASTNIRFVERGLILPDGSTTVAIYIRKLDPVGSKTKNNISNNPTIADTG